MTAKNVLPALFPFMVISTFMVRTGIVSFLEIFPGKLLEKLAGIKKEATGAVILGMLSGFPVGGVTVCELFKEGSLSKKEAEDSLCQAHNTGPAFPICFIGTYLWKSTFFGMCAYFSQIISMLLVSKLFHFKYSADNRTKKQPDKKINFTKALTDSITNAAFSTVTIFSYIVFWKTVCDIFESSHQVVYTIAASVLEFSSGTVASANLGGISGAAFTGFSIGFSGLAAILQTAAYATDVSLSVKKVFLFKLIQGFVCSILTVTAFCLLK